MSCMYASHLCTSSAFVPAVAMETLYILSLRTDICYFQWGGVHVVYDNWVCVCVCVFAGCNQAGSHLISVLRINDVLQTDLQPAC